MILPAILLVFATACTPDRIDREQPESTSCEAGFILDGSACVPESCGAGRWGDLPVDDDTVYVDVTAEEGGDGTEASPYATIQRGLNRAGALGGGLVAVASGTYPETLSFTSDHDEVHLAGRCREMVILDASVGDEETPGIGIDAGYGAVEVAGVTVRESSYVGLEMASGVAIVRDAAVVDSTYYGVVVYHSGFGGTTDVLFEDCLVEGNTEAGVYASVPDTRVTLRDTTVRDTQPSADGNLGRGINVQEGAILAMEGCLVDRNFEYGLFASDPGTQITASDTIVKDTQLDANGECGSGIVLQGGAILSAVGCIIEGNSEAGVVASDPDTRIALRDTTVKGTLSNATGEYGAGITVQGGATFSANGCVIDGNNEFGLAAIDSGSHVILRDTTVRDTQPNVNGGGGYGIGIQHGATLSAEGCLIDGNSVTGLSASDLGTQITLRDTIVMDTRPDANGEFGRGIVVNEGANLTAVGCLVEWNTDIGLVAYDPGTHVALRGTTIRDDGSAGIGVSNGATLVAEACSIDSNTEVGVAAYDSGTHVTLQNTTVKETQTDVNGAFGRGIDVGQGATLSANGCLIDGNVEVGVCAIDPATRITIRDSTISGTIPGTALWASAASGVTVQEGAFLSAKRLVVRSNQGPGLLANLDGVVECVACILQGNEFAGAVAINGGTLTISDSVIEGTAPGVDLLGGTGVYAWPWIGGPPAVTIANTLIQDNPVAGVWLIGNGTYVLDGNSISGGTGEPFGSGSRCGDAVLARDGVRAWDGTSGLLLQDNVFEDAEGAGVFLDGSAALMSGNAYSSNAVDLVVQNQSCDPIPAWYSEAPHHEFCPFYSYPTCYAEFFFVAVPSEPVDEGAALRPRFPSMESVASLAQPIHPIMPSARSGALSYLPGLSR